jgi:hypothetical protein
MRILIPMFLLLAACGNSDQDKLPDDLTSAEGTPTQEPEIEVEPEPEPAPPVNAVEVGQPEQNPGEQDVAPPPASMPRPSFDCSGSLNRVEALICSDPQLANLDRRLAREFDQAMDEGSPEQRDRLQRLGRRYLGDRNRCPTTDCVLQSYRWYLRDIELVMGWQSP